MGIVSTLGSKIEANKIIVTFNVIFLQVIGAFSSSNWTFLLHYRRIGTFQTKPVMFKTQSHDSGL